MRRGALLLLLGGCASRSPSDDALYLEAITGGLDPFEAVARCDRIRDPDLRGECILGLVETRSVPDAQLCESLYPGSRWRDGCIYAIAGLRELRVDYRWTLCEQAPPLLEACRARVIEVSLEHLHRGSSGATRLALATQSAIERMEAPEEAVAAAWTWTWVRWQGTQREVGFAPCEALEAELRASCEAGTAAAVEGLVRRGLAEEPERARVLCQGAPLVGFRPVDDGPKLAAEPRVEALARGAAEGFCRAGTP